MFNFWWIVSDLKNNMHTSLSIVAETVWWWYMHVAIIFCILTQYKTWYLVRRQCYLQCKQFISRQKWYNYFMTDIRLAGLQNSAHFLCVVFHALWAWYLQINLLIVSCVTESLTGVVLVHIASNSYLPSCQGYMTVLCLEEEHKHTGGGKESL